MTAAIAENDPLLRVTGLTAAFGIGDDRTEVLHGIDIQLRAGETVGIVGESGSGKSVTSLSLMRLIDSPPIDYEAGQILYDHGTVDLLQVDEAYLRRLRGQRIAMIFQEPMSSLNPVQRCGHQVDEMLRIHTSSKDPERKSATLELFSEVSLPDPERIYRSYPHELSGGQKQRVMIAMAMSCEPELLICDEPTTALDVTVQRDILDLLAALQQRTGMAMIFISHDLGVVGHIADRIIVMHRGSIVEQGTAQQILHAPRHPYTIGLLKCRPPVDGRPVRLPTVEDLLEDENYSPPMETEEERAARHDLLYSGVPIITATELKTWYPIKKGVFQRTVDHVKAVDGVDFELYKGETLGLVGESGCGKSTLGRTIVGLEEATSGQMTFKGEGIGSLSSIKRKAFRRKVQIIFQDPFSSLNPRSTVGRAISEPMIVHGLVHSAAEGRREAIALLERVGLGESHLDRYPHEFSGGQRQRISIARTLALRPEVVICDESVSALDVSVQAQVLNLLKDLKEEFDLTYLFISHDLAVVKYISDRVMVMRKGRIEEISEADRLYREPQSDYSRTLVGATFS